MNPLAIAPGFADSALDAQNVFRTCLEALSAPAKPIPLCVLPERAGTATPHGAFSPAMAALALALCDNETPIWLQPEADTPALRQYLRFHCSAVFAETPHTAAFAFIAAPQTIPRLSLFCQGTARYPEQSTTLVVATRFDSANYLSASGPGIGGEGGQNRPFPNTHMPAWFWHDWQAQQATYPLGVDVFFLHTHNEQHTTSLMGLPRTTRVADGKE